MLKRIGAETLIGQNGGIYFSSFHGWFAWLLIGFAPLTLLGIAFLVFLINLDREYFLRFCGISVLGGMHFALFIIATLGLGLEQLYLFGSGGRYLLVTHVTIFVLLVIIFERCAELKWGKFYFVTYWSLIAILITGIIFDFPLQSKTNPTFQLGWKKFASCANHLGPNCSVVVPPGGGWGISK